MKEIIFKFGDEVIITADCFHKGSKAVIIDMSADKYKIGILYKNVIICEKILNKNGFIIEPEVKKIIKNKKDK